MLSQSGPIQNLVPLRKYVHINFFFIVLCGPPGSGKTMTLFSALRALPDMEVVGLNFSSATTPELLLKTFDHYCEYRKTPNGVILSPVQVSSIVSNYLII